MKLGISEPKPSNSWSPLSRRSALGAGLKVVGFLGMPMASKAADVDIGNAVRVSVVRGAQLADLLDEKVS